LLVSLLTSVARFRAFFVWLVPFVGIVACLSLMNYYHLIKLPTQKSVAGTDGQHGLHDRAPAREATEDESSGVAGSPDHPEERRLTGTGLFWDPNDLCLILVVAMVLSIYWLTDRAGGPLRAGWLGPLVLFGYTLAATQSRGGFLAMAGGAFVLFQARFGWKKCIPLFALVLPLMLVVFAGRQTDLGTLSEGTGRGRIELWRDGFVAMKQSPLNVLFGIGLDKYVEAAGGHVAHNSFVHAFVELGVIGGTLFTAMFYLSAWPLYRLQGRMPVAPDVARLRPYLLAVVAASVVGMLSLSRNYVTPTYMISGLSAAYFSLPALRISPEVPRISKQLLVRVALVAFLTLVFHLVVAIRG
jgi:hypothetical protein